MNAREYVSNIPAPYCEQWRQIPGWVGKYEVSDLGRIRSISRTHIQSWNGRHTYTGKVLAQATVRGYRVVTLTYPGIRFREYVHTIVLSAFVGAKPIGHEACHNDGVRTNNKLTNLRWDSRVSNMADKKLHGTQPFGSKHALAKLTEELVREIRASNESSHAISRRLGIHVMTISKARRSVTWKHVK